VDDPPRSARFYRAVFGFTSLVTSERLIALAVREGQVLLLFKKRDSLSLRTPHDSDGQLHVAFAIPANTVDDWRAHLAGCGVAIEEEVAWESGGRSLYFRDPDGHLVEVGSPGIWTNN
jgi:catechol 2,3-dioxygenase-like lactoylglutathione lyase family enzyme